MNDLPNEPPSLPAQRDGSRGLPGWFNRGFAIVAIVVLAPLLLLISLCIKLSSPGPVLFFQNRVGRGGREFRMMKFRSMTTQGPVTGVAPLDESAPQVTARGDARVTRFGSILRATKLDELPELINIVRGEMHLVGPRPEVPRYVDLNDPGWRQVLSAVPGLTDQTTLLLRNEEALLEQLASTHGLDVETVYRESLLPFKLRTSGQYLERRTAWSDLGLLARTLVAIFVPASQLDLEDID